MDRKPLNLDPTQRIEIVPPDAVRFFSHPDTEVIVELYPYPTYHMTVTRTFEGRPISHQIQVSKATYAGLLAEMSRIHE